MHESMSTVPASAGPTNRPSPDTAIPPPEHELDAALLRETMSRFATGVVAVTAFEPDGAPIGLAVNSFTSVSLDPPLVAFCVAHTSSSWPRLRTAGRFCLNVLGDGQRHVAAQLSGKPDKFRGLRWSPVPAGAPVLVGALAWLECSVDAEHPAGDHVIVVSRVHHAEPAGHRYPLVFFDGEYGTFGRP